MDQCIPPTACWVALISFNPCTHFRDREIEARRGDWPCPRSCIKQQQSQHFRPVFKLLTLCFGNLALGQQSKQVLSLGESED